MTVVTVVLASGTTAVCCMLKLCVPSCPALVDPVVYPDDNSDDYGEEYNYFHILDDC